jgi:pyrimidine 5'-nucleotidase
MATSRVTFWDIDGCLYPNSLNVGQEISNNMQAFMTQRLAFSPASILAKETEYYRVYGNTLRGLRANGYDVDLKTWYDAVHKPLLYSGFFKRDQALRNLLLSLPGRHIIFTNADPAHAEAVLRRLNIRDCFEPEMVDIFRMNPDGASTDLICKPDPRAFECALAVAGIPSGVEVCFIDDSRANTREGKRQGWYTVQIGVTTCAEEDADACCQDVHRVGEFFL